jgi:DNA-binding LytR/AlgR family response regulator
MAMKQLRCLVVDDEELARILLKTYIQKNESLSLIGTIENPLDALPILQNQEVDVLFLDIQMPEMSGTAMAKIVNPKTRIIFTTAYSEYAITGFDLNVLDYLLKPITFERFQVAIEKAQNYFQPSKQEETITIKSGYDLHKIRLDEILFIEGSSEYVIFQTATKRIMSYQTLKSLELSLPNQHFMRVHRSYIVNKIQVNALKSKDLMIRSFKIPVSETYFEEVRKYFLEK